MNKKQKPIRQRIRGQELSFTVVFDPVPEGGYQVTAPVLPGLITYGRTLAEAREMARDALRCHLEAMRKAGEPLPDERNAHTEKLRVALSA